MKTLVRIIIISVYLLCIRSQAQSIPSARVHFLNTMGYGISAELKMTSDPRNTLKIKSSTWVVIQTVGDSLEFVINNKPYSLHFEANRVYYFIIQISHFSRPIVTEKSEREFMLTAMVDAAKGPEEISLGRSNN